jgi:hypothetical protein
MRVREGESEEKREKTHDVDAVHDGASLTSLDVDVEVEVLSDTSTGGSVHADGVNFIKEGDGAVLLSEVADLADGSDGAGHGVDRLEGDDLGRLEGKSSELGLEVDEVVVLEDDLGSLAVAHALDHRSVVHLVGEDNAAGKLRSESSDCWYERSVLSEEREREGRDERVSSLAT